MAQLKATTVNGALTVIGTATADGLTLGANELITLGAQTLKHDGTDFVFNDSVNIAGFETIKSTVTTTGGGYTRKFLEATGTPAGTTTYFDIALSIPASSKLLGVQLRVDTALTAGETWSAAYITGSTTAIASAGTAVAKSTKVNKMHIDEITSAITNIRITRDAGNFTNAVGVIRAIAYYEVLETLSNAP